MRHLSLSAAVVFCATIIRAANLPTYYVGTQYTNTTLQVEDNSCYRTWYGPTIYQLANGNLHLLAQGVNLQTGPAGCPESTPDDSVYAATRENVHGCWSTPGNAVCGNPSDPLPPPGDHCPEVFGKYIQCSFSPTVHGPVASPSVVQLPDGRYVMAFVGGNADKIAGKVYWAVSTAAGAAWDGRSWTVYNELGNGTWQPIVYGKNAPECIGSTPAPNGIGQVGLTFDPSTNLLYLFMNYYNYGAPNNTVTRLAYRMDYNPNGLYRVGSSVRQVFHNGLWEDNSGQFVWTYETGQADGTPIPNQPVDCGTPGRPQCDRVLAPNTSMNTLVEAGNAILWDPRPLNPTGTHGLWVKFGIGFYQLNTSLDTNTWTNSAGVPGQSSPMANFPANAYNLGVGAWYGTIVGNQSEQVTDMYLWITVTGPDRNCQSGPVANLKLLPATAAFTQ